MLYTRRNCNVCNVCDMGQYQGAASNDKRQCIKTQNCIHKQTNYTLSNIRIQKGKNIELLQQPKFDKYDIKHLYGIGPEGRIV
jgi:hypothetical protein